MTGPFTATVDLGAPFQVQNEPYALATATVMAPQPASGNRGLARTVPLLLALLVAAALAFTYRKRPAQ